MQQRFRHAEWRYARFEPHENSVERLAISLRSVSAVTAVHDSITDNPLSPEELRTRVKEAARSPSFLHGILAFGPVLRALSYVLSQMDCA